MATRSPVRFPIMAVAMIALLTGMWAGLLRIGWTLPAPRLTFGLAHGPLMISGFLGTLIGLERAVALGRPWAYAGPVLTALAGLALVAGSPQWVAPVLLTAGSAGLVAVFAVIVWDQAALFTVTMGLGAVAWFVSNGLWLGGAQIFAVVSWWMSFLVLTIAGERLELSRLLQRSRASETAFIGILALFIVGVSVGGLASGVGARLTGLALIGLTLWLLCYDIARRTVRQSGLTRFTAVCLLSGYFWLAVSGVLAVYFGAVLAGAAYDAILHAVFLGFVFAMIFGHAPIIFPAVLGLPVPFRPAFYAHLTLLHVSVALRLVGDLLPLWPARQWGGLLNAVAVLLFLVNTVLAVRLGRRPATMRTRATDAACVAAVGDRGHDRGTSSRSIV